MTSEKVAHTEPKYEQSRKKNVVPTFILSASLSLPFFFVRLSTFASLSSIPFFLFLFNCNTFLFPSLPSRQHHLTENNASSIPSMGLGGRGAILASPDTAQNGCVQARRLTQARHGILFNWATSKNPRQRHHGRVACASLPRTSSFPRQRSQREQRIQVSFLIGGRWIPFQNERDEQRILIKSHSFGCFLGTQRLLFRHQAR